MLRQALSANVRNVGQRRGFVSTVLLTRDWSNKSLGALKREAKQRGLLQTGNKATLITRLQEFERDQALQSPTPVPQQQQVRHASNVEAAGVPSSSQPAPAPPSYPKEFLAVRIPETHHLAPEPPIAVPFVPDFWDSSKVKAESSPPQAEQPSNPKVLTVAGAETLIGGGPSHNLYPDTLAPPTALQPVKKKGMIMELVHDFVPEIASISLPPRKMSEDFLKGVAEITETTGAAGHHHSRTLDKDEKNGVLALVGLFVGSWLLAGIFAPKSAFAEEHAEKSVSEKAAESL
ncbi:uncharacterized protein PHACADRAFT_256346 [Phanerochaete carnosa HHB-10118-sp]|uniref:SAP domain-containing protein n=1 Tax=Phanerochaete carnosa (strain HHB-10118-sp) TaxID=650164 RepID=K5UZK7_PHACS|nr:uncharacterized protein PHACADRAFT_256346 [Phanerochaete carnosa HHB-10118-sp]EKM55611.1 hypothetical protein PHACADRAFT_256346 [Phanerochaete carnosa HHB-10118-sp]